MDHALNTFLTALREVCSDHLLAEKWLVAPSLRVGFQWLDAVTRSGQPVINVRVKTFRHMALELAAPEMDRQGLTFLRVPMVPVLISRVFESFREEGSEYLSELSPSHRLAYSLNRTIRDLRLTGFDRSDLKREAFEVEDKCSEMGRIIEGYKRALKDNGLVDYADVLTMASLRAREHMESLSSDTLVLIPVDDLGWLYVLEKSLWLSIPEAGREVLPVDSYPPMLVWSSTKVPEPAGDRAASMFRAVGEANEVREVLRRCVERQISLDEVEIVYTDTETYVPLIFELSVPLMSKESDAPPVTFAEGLPARYSRPGRALEAWVSWGREGFPQTMLVNMLQDGLLLLPEIEQRKHSQGKLAAALRAVGICANRDRYLPALDAKLAALRQRAETALSGRGEKHRSAGRGGPAEVRQQIETLEEVRSVVTSLLHITPAADAGQRAVLKGAISFLEDHVYCVTQLDAYSLEKLLDEISDLLECLGDGAEEAGLDAWEWLAQLPHSVRIGGQGPQAGCIHASSLELGGHSGRRYIYIVGLDDSRFPGTGLQDPLLLDSERLRLSKELPTAASRLTGKTAAFDSLLARLRGNVTLSYSCRSLDDEREMFPSGPLLSTYRILSGKRHADQSMMVEGLPQPASFGPRGPDCCIGPAEWWLWALCGTGAGGRQDAAIREHFPHLARGLVAFEARASDRLTEYDGYVPEAGRDLDPTSPDGQVLSSSRLEMLGRCPMEYFLHYALGIKPPEEYLFDPSVWLSVLQKGILLHQVFSEFHRYLQEEKRLPAYERDAGALYRILEERIELSRRETPPPTDEIFASQCRELRQICRIFLQEEDEFCRGSHPVSFEIAVGVLSEGRGTFLDSRQPVEMKLPTGKKIRLRGKIDRLDEVPDSGRKRFTVWDYKTGGSTKYEGDDPFQEGRCVQGIVYLTLAEARLREEISPQASVQKFGYFFPNTREHGRRLSWSREELDRGPRVIADLCEMITLGCFCFTDCLKDVRYSDYSMVFGDPRTEAENVKRKIRNPSNLALEPFRRLRPDAGNEGD